MPWEAKERRAENDTLQTELRIVKQVSVDQEAAHGVAVEESGDAIDELLQEASQVVMHFLEIRTRAACT